MLDLSSSDPALFAYAQRAHDESLPAGLTRADFAAFSSVAYGPEDLAAGRSAWCGRALDEYRSQLAFTRFLSKLTEVAFPWDVLSLAVRVVRDEARHTELCRRMVVALGGDARIEGTPVLASVDEGQSVGRQICETIITSLCVGETVSVRLLSAARDAAQDPLAKRALTAVLADEAIHSRFGWTLLELLLPVLEPQDRAYAEGLIVPCLEASAGAAARPAIAHSFGALSAEERADVFADALRNHVRARFRALGLPH